MRATEGTMAGREISVKRYVVRLSAEERERLEALIRKGKSPASRLLKARILLKADVSARLHFMKPFRPPRPGGWSSASNGTTRPNTEVGSISPNPSSASCHPNASIAVFPTNRPLSRKLPPGSTIAMPDTARPIGTSQPPMRVSNSNTYTLQSE
jgi:hypothetical protein